MRKYIYYILLICGCALTIYALSACSKDSAMEVNPIQAYNDFGEISFVGKDGYFEIMRDDNTLLRVVKYVGTKKVKLGERVYFKYTIVTPDDNGSSDYTTTRGKSMDIKLILFNNIHAAPIVKHTFLLQNDPHRSDSLGKDLVRIYKAAFSGNYVNIEFEYFRYANSKTPHMINLVWDNTLDPLGTANLYLRHNAFGETDESKEIVSDTGLASFKLTDLIPEGKSELPLKIWYNLDRKNGVGEYIKVDKYCEGVFKPNMTTKTYIAGSELSPLANNDNIFVK